MARRTIVFFSGIVAAAMVILAADPLSAQVNEQSNDEAYLTEGSISGPSFRVYVEEFRKCFIAGDTVIFSFTIENTRSEESIATISFFGGNMPGGWTSKLCTGPNECPEPTFPFPLSYTLPGKGSHTFYVKISAPAGIGNSGWVRVHVSGPNEFLNDFVLDACALTTNSVTVDWGTTSKEFLSGESETYSFMITNNRSEPARITINRAAQSLPDGWTSEICTGLNDCDTADNVTYTLPDSYRSHTFYLKVNSAASEVGESGTVRLGVQGPGDFVADQIYDAGTRTTSSSVAIPGEVGGLSMRSITPNPASSVARIDVSIPVGSQTTLEIFTIGGEKVATLFEGHLEAGMRQINADVSALESGKYLLVLKSGEKRVGRTITVVR